MRLRTPTAINDDPRRDRRGVRTWDVFQGQNVGNFACLGCSLLEVAHNNMEGEKYGSMEEASGHCRGGMDGTDRGMPW